MIEQTGSIFLECEKVFCTLIHWLALFVDQNQILKIIKLIKEVWHKFYQQFQQVILVIVY